MQLLLRWCAQLAETVVLGIPTQASPCSASSTGLQHNLSKLSSPLAYCAWVSETAWYNVRCHLKVLKDISKIFVGFLHEYNPLVTHYFNFVCNKLTFLFKVTSKKQNQKQRIDAVQAAAAAMVVCLLQ